MKKIIKKKWMVFEFSHKSDSKKTDDGYGNEIYEIKKGDKK